MSEKIGILGQKLGMTQVFGGNGFAVPVTVVQAGPCPIVQIKTVEKEGYNALQIAFGEGKKKHVSKSMQGHFSKAGLSLYRKIQEVRLKGSLTSYEVGQVLTVGLFSVGDKVKITGKSIGKGFQGAMRRWNFAGSKDSHGCEKVHRAAGSIGNNTFPGHVFKGKKMAGHWGTEKVTVQNLVVVDIRPEDNIILIHGSVPGPKNSFLFISMQ
ncbi:50S ribosomal protein L3 [Lawsonia intracellularis]|uniref:Large ribosomal subunit protein uL3 n=1 Tax=Lawsonia intracellularis (strain PHE/MN1-00) TaxID=363253 RepID=RL3_LAWIP|nr:50S ribosomal protein L3 [Lawsonia intracellularis]Q1MPR3.1 RecName: Full=Large ribosomal subunit protein uL3; AltName: Full=50S ribosomal protein L3 [Lawsonia intracellularis PHE/MN1-00]AGC50388.1 50S ribosomal protein L3 [Lawsonia intracellularis N343]KAA0204410.1 50S ribosomal protein L3 [Lawsonia intracellularis]MBZ3892835.1 50S ribosomal protein L3 [Lawsonia intracellularis]RBN33005.1 50S ribosomal protein L3 [Lawsonia intracellularis]RBN35173.1 50S ribosomal protein L3 [Lawsonia intr